MRSVRHKRAISPAIQASEIYSLNQSHTFMFRNGLLSKTSVWRSYTHLSLFKLFISNSISIFLLH